jgi:DNA polymerase-3 subunit alpha
MVDPFWSTHTHSKYSFNDALPSVEQIVAEAVQLDYPALGLTDHGGVSGSIELYSACRKAGIEPLPGIEAYVVPDAEYAGRKDNMHLTINAYCEIGYRNLINLANVTQRKFWYKPRIDFADFAEMAEAGATKGLVVSTGCFFGVLPQTLMRQGEAAAVQVANALAGWFPRVYVEVQHHGIIEHNVDFEGAMLDEDLMYAMVSVAKRAGLPIIITRDSHYVLERDRWLHNGLKRLVSFSEDPDEAIFPGGGYFMTDREGMSDYFPTDVLDAGCASLADLANVAHVRLPEMETFTMKVPDITINQDPYEVLKDKVNKALVVSDWWGEAAYADVYDAELAVIKTSGMAPYILVVDKVCTWMREQGISYHARGSAGGSLVLRLLKITQVDPLRFKLRFDRFLSPDRTRPPDVDLDVEHVRRDEVVAWMSTWASVRQVGSHMTYSLFDEDEDEEGRGSLRVRYYSTRKKQGLGGIEWSRIPAEDKRLLNDLSKRKLYSGYGTHAAGFIVAPDDAALDQLPLAWIASSKKFVTAYGKKPVEKLGFLKLDLLGLRTRTAIRITTELTGIDFEAIPEDDVATYRRIGSGRTAGIFQLEGGTFGRGCREIKPKVIEDIIDIQALFRPAAMHAGATNDYKARKFGKQPVPIRHADIMVNTEDTYGVLLYQEQVMAVLRALGMTPADLTDLLDALKASNDYVEGARKVIDEHMPHIRSMAADRGWTELDIDWLANAIEAYAEYGFGKAHAAQYGLISYRCAYLLTNHPVDFWAGMLTAYADHKKKAPIYIGAARADAVPIYPAHVNRSGYNYTVNDEHTIIRKGLISVKGVGPVGAAELVAKAPFTSLTDLGRRVLPKRVSGAAELVLHKTKPRLCGGKIEALDEAGALDGLEFE